MAQTQQPMGSSPLANMMQTGAWRGPVPAVGQPGIPQGPASLGQMGNAMANYGAMPNAQTTTGMQTPQQNMMGAALGQMGAGAGQPQIGAIQGMRRQPPPGAPGQGAGGGKGAAPGQQQMKQQIAQLPGAPQPGMFGRLQQMRQRFQGQQQQPQPR